MKNPDFSTAYEYKKHLGLLNRDVIKPIIGAAHPVKGYTTNYFGRNGCNLEGKQADFVVRIRPINSIKKITALG